jgi:transcription termination/antitermination protein NusG
MTASGNTKPQVQQLSQMFDSGLKDDCLSQWFLLRTRSRQEKALGYDLAMRGIAMFLPLIECKRCHGGRFYTTVTLPVFPGYLFMRGDVDEAYEAERTGRVAQVVRVCDQQRLDRELRNIHLALQRQAPLSLTPYLHRGVRVELRAGPFRGLQGVIKEVGHRDRLVLQVEILGRAVGLEVDGSLLDVVD